MEFPDYTPKQTSDTIFDYAGAWCQKTGFDSSILVKKVGGLSKPLLENLVSLLIEFRTYEEESKKYPGVYQSGNLILGAEEREYVPSEPEILLSEVGRRIEIILNTFSKEKIIEYTSLHNVGNKEIRFTRINYYHVDVMGSGRFFYAEKGQVVRLLLQS
ncbi:MAG: hypothetical protein ACTSUE_20935 [Promethearchaeota archaeon]